MTSDAIFTSSGLIGHILGAPGPNFGPRDFPLLILHIFIEIKIRLSVTVSEISEGAPEGGKGLPGCQKVYSQAPRLCIDWFDQLLPLLSSKAGELAFPRSRHFPVFGGALT